MLVCNEADRGKMRYMEKLSQCHFTHHKSQTT